MIARGDEDFALALPYARAEDRPRLEALFALQLEIRRIPAAVSEPPLGEIRLQWWRDALDEIIAADLASRSGLQVRAHPVVEALRSTGAMTTEARGFAEQAIDAQASMIYKDPFRSVEPLSDFAYDAEGSLIVAAYGEGEHRPLVEKAARAYALAKFSPQVAPNLADEAKIYATDLWKEVASGLTTLNARDAGRIIILALTPGYLKRRQGQEWPLVKQAILFKAMLSGRF